MASELSQLPKPLADRWTVLVNKGQFVREQQQTALQFGIGKNWQKVLPTKTEDAIFATSPTFAAIAKYYGEDNTLAVLIGLLAEAGSMLNVSKNITPDQLRMSAQILLPDVRTLKVADVRLALHNGLRGKYGETFGRFDVQIAAGWVKAYFSERLDVAGALAESAHKSQISKEESKGVEMPEYFRKFLAELERQKASALLAGEDYTADPDYEAAKKEFEGLPVVGRPGFNHYFTQFKILKNAN